MDGIRLLAFKDLAPAKGINYSREHLARLVKQDRFPRPVVLSSQRVAWIESEIDEWLADLSAKRDSKLMETA